MKSKYRISSTKSVLSYFIPFLSLYFVGCINNIQIEAQRPNVIIVLTDDQGYGDIAIHGNPIIKTPNIDKLYEQSIHFTQFHVAPMCTPTRGELMTGQDAFRNGSVFVSQGKSLIHRGIPTIADVFGSNGYATGHFGKWHLGDNYPYRPQDRGFQETVHHGAWGVTSMADYWSNDYFDDTYSHNGKHEKYKGYSNDVWFNEAMKWMKKQAGEKKPFFCYVPTNVAHVPRIVKESYMNAYEGSISDIETQAFFGMIANFDESIGRLEHFLVENGLRDNTILIFMTDNGTDGGDKIYNAGMRGKKRSYYDGGHRVPFYIRWPAKGIEGARDIKELTHSTDLFPTLVEMCGLKKDKISHLDGMDLSGLISGKESKLSDRMKVISYQVLDKKKSAVLWNNWRLVNYTELYNIEQDPGQQNNIGGQHSDIVSAMQEHYNIWELEMAEIDKQLDLISIGTNQEPETFLCSANWTGAFADSWRNIYDNAKLIGNYNLAIESTGKYEISLYRWPKESGRALTDDFYNINIEHSAIFNRAGENNPARLAALPVSAVRLKVDKQVFEKSADSNATHVTFEIDLKKGRIINIEPVLLNTKGEELCGAYFTYVKKVQ